MPTVRDIVERAYRKIGVVASDEPMTADQADAGADAINDMMHGWKADGVDIAHVDVVLSDEFPLDPMFREGAVYMLAARLAPDFSVASFNTTEFMQRLSAHYLIVDDVDMPLALLCTPSQRRLYRAS
jgi:hypothetical protein